MTQYDTAARRPLQTRNGYSLIELMIVVGLIGILAGISVPAISAGMRRYSLISASQQVVSTIRSARVMAVGKNRIVRVRFDFPADDQYQIVAPDGTALGPVMLLPQGATFGAVSNVIFTTAGRLDPAVAAPVTIVVSNGDATQNRTISVTASGRVQLP